MRLRDCERCLVYGTDNRPLSRARVEIDNEMGIRLFFRNPKLRSVRFRTTIDFYDRSQGVVRCRCELVIQRNSYPNRMKEPWMADCEILDIEEIFQRQKDLRVKLEKELEFTSTVHGHFMGTIHNISVGGIMLYTEMPLTVDEEIEFRYCFLKREYEVKAVILREQEMIKKRHVYGCQFIDLTKSAERDIRQFVFKQQLKRIW